MTLQSGYTLPKLKMVLISKLRWDLSDSVRKLGCTIKRLEGMTEGFRHGVPESVSSPSPERLPRRAWRVWYNKAPHAIGWSKRHYIFHDWRYAFDFHNIVDIRYDE